MIFCQRDFLMNSISSQLQLVKDRIAQACQVSQRTPNSVELIAVSKTQPATYVKLAFEAGQRHFGENYVQEAIEKIIALQEIKSLIKWHFIGPLQSNKTPVVAESFDWVQSVDRLKIAQRLSQQRPSHLPDLQVLVQVNMSGENSKSGTHPSEAEALCKAITKLPHLKLRGLMSIPEAGNVALAHQKLRELFKSIQSLLPQDDALQFDTISMGMSEDLEQAIAAGSSMVRVGTAIFGSRTAKAVKLE
jgi:pyridoxal phosphate enzyme (YggS family)